MTNFSERLEAWEHAGNILIPISFLVRLYPRALDHGNPDLIESTAQFLSGAYGAPELFDDFPSTTFTVSGEVFL